MTGTRVGARGFVFVLASWQMDAPAGIERATAALARGLADAGHRVAIATAVPRKSRSALGGVAIEHLDLSITFPCSDEKLRKAVLQYEGKLQARLWEIIARHQADTVVFTDALWGLGRLAAALPDGVCRVLAAHVLPNAEDAPAALSRADTVIVPSPVVTAEAQAAGLPTRGWRVVPNALLLTPSALPDDAHIERRRSGPVRVLARLGHEKGLVPLLTAAADWVRELEVMVAAAGFEAATGSQARLLAKCRALADASAHITLSEGGLAWREVPTWLAGAAAVIVPSLRETFGLVALEAMSEGVPVVSYPVGNLPALLEHQYATERLMGDPRSGPNTLLDTVDALLTDPVAYGRTSKAMYHLAQDYRPDRIALQFIKAVS
ncbi:glycosyltransferase family 4 protein [Streptomyces sp. G44]|uniref:glycosyltransferase family 4 protein n=1 Tax=Streptomyces sp. G44 TaxID=2807632 RepID=UPI00195F2A64|nr:glycosyltransferase family 4 protein [Streptomyces sp. G44]MBM7167142.1 glycosyltransferase family 4 protein [Streptomyces sp. G44]